MRQLFCFWQFNGDNADWCNFRCPYCYAGSEKNMVHKWNGDIDGWEKAFLRLNRDIYFNLCYGEPMGSKGFYEVLDLIGKHDNWEANLITNLSYDPKRMLNTKVAKDGRLYVIASWHPHGGGDWDSFRDNLITLRQANIEPIVIFVMFPPQCYEFQVWFKWLRDNNFIVYPRRFFGNVGGRWFPKAYPDDLKAHLAGFSSPKTNYYNLFIHSPKGKLCTALKDMILVKYNGDITPCADIPGKVVGNIFDESFKLSDKAMECPQDLCGGCYGLLHLEDQKFGRLPDKLDHKCFILQTEQISGGGREKVNYPYWGWDYTDPKIRKKVGWQ